MAQLVERGDIVDIATYEDRRETTRPHALQAKHRRRVHVHDNLTLLFENRDTLRYQIQEIMRAEQIVREADIIAEIATYNALLGVCGELGAVLLIEIPDAQMRAQLLRDWQGLQQHVYVAFADGSKVYASFDPSQVGDERISAVQYLCFAVDGRVPVAVGTDFDGLESHAELTAEQIDALTEDLATT